MIQDNKESFHFCRMENKVESPDYQMDISEAGTTTADNISTSSASPTISNQADSEICLSEKRSGIDSTMNSTAETITKNMNLIQLATSNSRLDKENLENRNNLTLDMNQQQNPSIQKLTPVRHHPLEMFDDDVEDACNYSNPSNFPDVVLAHHQPSAKNHADIVNSVNNNSAKLRKPIYREPSPVSYVSSLVLTQSRLNKFCNELES